MVVYLTGTEMRQIPLQDHSISTPGGLKRALEDPRSRQYYILDADVHIATMKSLATMAKTDQDGNVLLSPTGGRRRVDLILYRNVQDDTTSQVSPLVGVNLALIHFFLSHYKSHGHAMEVLFDVGSKCASLKHLLNHHIHYIMFTLHLC